MSTDKQIRQRANSKRYHAQLRERDPVGALLQNLRYRAKKYRRMFSLSRDDLAAVWPKDNICPVLKVPMVPYTELEPSVDRRRNELGYVKGNIAVISRHANRLKNDATIEEIRAVLAYAEGGAP